ncbi:hypothetical protein FACS1894116_10170 [Betaproteobacteria bacterium]|nr:hypothetical protein FACS1894116_10170 [Betaproteobacteria bacterium]GHU00004.1 hypothetical protein FACS1894154_08260 [Betaproteobacteria bacterium]
MNLLRNQALLDASCRVAFAALVHDLGKFAERAAPEIERDRLDAHIQNYCKWHEQGGYHSHRHAAHTALFLDVVEQSAPDLIRGEVTPFASRQDGTEADITDSLINAAAMHHRPETLLRFNIALISKGLRPMPVSVKSPRYKGCLEIIQLPNPPHDTPENSLWSCPKSSLPK